MSTHKKVIAVVLKVDNDIFTYNENRKQHEVLSKSRSIHILMGEQYTLSDEEIHKLNLFINNKYSDSQLTEAKESDFKGGWYFMLDLSRHLVDILGKEEFQIASVNDKLLCEYDECDKQLHTTLPELQNITEYPYFGFLNLIRGLFLKVQLSPRKGDMILARHHAGKMGIYTKGWDVIIPCKYGHIGCYWNDNGYGYKLQLDNLVVTLIDLVPDAKRANLLLQYDWVEKIGKMDKGGYLVTRNGLVGICDNTEKNIIPTLYNEIKLLDNGVYQVTQNGLWGLCASDGQVLAPVIYNTITTNTELTGQTLFLVSQNGKYGVFEEFGKWQIPCEYNGFQSCNSTSCIIAVLSDRDYILYRGGRKISRAYQKIREFNDGVAIINMGGSWRTYNNRRYFRGGKYGLINEIGKVILLCDMFSDMFFIGDGLYVAMFYNIKNEKRYQIINKDGKLVSKITIDYDELKYCGIPRHFFVLKNKKYGLYNYLSEEIIKCEFDEICTFDHVDHKWVARVCLNNRYGYINEKGNMVKSFTYKQLPYSYETYLYEDISDPLEEQREMERDARFYMSEGSVDSGGMDWDTLMDYLGY